MKTISLEAAKQAATPGKLTADCMRVYTNDGEFWIASTDTPGPATDEEAVANAALLAHSWNIRDELIEALEKSLDRQYDPQNPAKNSDLRAVLQRAREVEMP